jgi:hypothetical protein
LAAPLQHRLSPLAFSLTLAATIGCNGDDVIAPPTTGTLEITTSTTGEEPDQDGYSVQLDAEPAQAIGLEATVTRTDVAVGSHTVLLGEVAGNCEVAGENPRPVSIAGGDTIRINFTVTCTATTGGLEITTATTGTGTDADGYTVSIDGEPEQAIGINAVLPVPGVPAGRHEVTLGGLDAECTVSGENPSAVIIRAGTTESISFSVTCTAPAPVPSWSPMRSGTNAIFNAVWGTSGSDVFAVGEHGPGFGGSSIHHYDGLAWSQQFFEENIVLEGVWGSSGTDVFAVGGEFLGAGALYHYDGSAWSAMTGLELPDPWYSDVWGTSPTNVYAVGEYFDGRDLTLIAQYDGTAWSEMVLDNPDFRIAQGIHGTSPTDIFVVGYYFPQDAWFVLHYDGTQWTDTAVEGGAMFDVWANSPTDVFAVGTDENGGAIWHYDGSSWTQMEVPRTQSLSAVWGTSGSDVYAVGPKILHYDGTEWTEVNERGGADVWGSSASDVFVVGSNGRILHGP